MPLSRRRCTLALSAWSEPCTLMAEIVQHFGDAAHADAADADEMDEPDALAAFSCAVSLFEFCNRTVRPQ